MPAHLADLLDRPERCDLLPAEFGAVRSYVERAVAAH
jgi:hypothetical protein